MIHTYVDGKNTKDGKAMLIIGLEADDLVRATAALNRSGGEFQGIKPSAHCPLHIGIVVRKTNEDLVAMLEKIMTELNPGVTFTALRASDDI